MCLSKYPEYTVWCGMKHRCGNKNSASYRYYGGKGITVCPSWEKSFAQFISDMGRRPNSDYSIERLDNDKGYSPENCKWATISEQVRNRSSNVPLEYLGEKKILADWYDFLDLGNSLGMSQHGVYSRINDGWDTHSAFTTTKAEACVYLVFGELLTTKEIREQYGVCRTTLEYRLEKGFEDEALVSEVPDVLTYDVGLAERLTERQIEDLHSVNRRSFRRRVAAGITGKALLASTNSPTFYNIKGKKLSANMIAQECGVGFYTAKALLEEAEETGVCVYALLKAKPAQPKKAPTNSLYLYKDEMLTVNQIALASGLAINTVRYRLKVGKPLSSPNKRALIAFEGRLLMSSEWAAIFGLSRSRFSELYTIKKLTMREICDGYKK